jgi:N-acetylneuraminate lyase
MTVPETATRRSRRPLRGLIAAAFTPMQADGSIAPRVVPRIVDHLIADGVDGLFVCGSTGEGPSLTCDERRATADAYIDATAGRLPVVVHVGHNSLAVARELASHADGAGADAIAMTPPSYFVPASPDVLIDCIEHVAGAAPDTPMYYYHIPLLTRVGVDMVDLLDAAAVRLPSLAGVKFSDLSLPELQVCADAHGDRFTILSGVDEQYLHGMIAGADGAIGSTYNFAAPLYRTISGLMESGDVESAGRAQVLAARMCRTILRFPGQPALKATMSLIGFDCGPNRLPLRSLTNQQRERLRQDLEGIGFFDWARGQPISASLDP